MQKRVFFIIGVFLLLAHTVSAQSFCVLDEKKPMPKKVVSLEAFRSLPVLHQGRIKPIDTYAEHLLLQFSGRRSVNGKKAIEWLADLIFAPAATQNDKVFLINHPDIPQALGIPLEKKRRYSFIQLQPSIQKLYDLAKSAQAIDEKQRDIVENEILRVYRNIDIYIQLTFTTTFAFPHNDFLITDQEIIKELNLPLNQGGYSFLDLVKSAEVLQKALNGLDQAKISEWTDKQMVYFTLMNNLFSWSVENRGFFFDVIPTAGLDNEAWLSPWDAITQEFYDENVENEATYLRDMTVHYWNNEQLQFNLAGRNLKNSILKRVSDHERKAIKKFNQELFYNDAKLFFWAKLFYGLAFLFYLLSFYLPLKKIHTAGFWLIIIGFIPHTIALCLRMSILSRPPVSNLYETFIFVGFVSVLCGIIVEKANKRWLGIAIASICGLSMLMIANKYSAEGDTLGMLVAVLNSNFWLSTHVISITIGYAGCCVAGVVGHIYILQNVLKPKDKELLASTYSFAFGTLGFGLTMTFLGTVLGGIWADQSWGRFWGWDPKENGALLIVLWSAIIFHARIAGWIKPLGFAVGTVLGITVVMWAWFGVNLLGVGLHSYGFTSGVAFGLVIFVICEIVFLGIAVPLASERMESSADSKKKAKG